MTQRRTFQGLLVDVEYGIPTERGEGARVTMPDHKTQRVVTVTEDHPVLDMAICFAVNEWRVAKWRESGHGGVI